MQIKLGDIVEIATSAGLAYAQCMHKHANYGSLLRVFSGVHANRPADFADLLAGDVQFVCFFPLQAAVQQGIVKVVGNAALSADASRFPIFRTGAVDPSIGKVRVWWLWDGDREWRIDTLTSQQRFLPIRGVWNDTLLIERILGGWRPENDATT